MYFKLLIYTCFCILNGLVDMITKNASVKTSLYLNFTLEDTYYCISYVLDVMPPMAAFEKFSNYLMNWFRIQYNSRIENLKFYVGSSYLFQTSQTYIKDKHEEVDVLHNFWKKKCQQILPVFYIPTLASFYIE